jgi:ketosteroid isomerase-like protein
MLSREAMIDTINRAYDARGKGDIEGLMAAFHPNAVFELKGDKKTLQVAGAVQGHSNVRAALTGFIDTFEFMKRDIVDVTVEDNREDHRAGGIYGYCSYQERSESLGETLQPLRSRRQNDRSLH